MTARAVCDCGLSEEAHLSYLTWRDGPSLIFTVQPSRAVYVSLGSPRLLSFWLTARLVSSAVLRAAARAPHPRDPTRPAHLRCRRAPRTVISVWPEAEGGAHKQPSFGAFRDSLTLFHTCAHSVTRSHSLHRATAVYVYLNQTDESAYGGTRSSARAAVCSVDGTCIASAAASASSSGGRSLAPSVPSASSSPGSRWRVYLALDVARPFDLVLAACRRDAPLVGAAAASPPSANASSSAAAAHVESPAGVSGSSSEGASGRRSSAQHMASPPRQHTASATSANPSTAGENGLARPASSSSATAALPGSPAAVGALDVWVDAPGKGRGLLLGLGAPRGREVLVLLPPPLLEWADW